MTVVEQAMQDTSKAKPTSPRLFVWAGLAVIVLLGAFLRLQATAHTIVELPIRADAAHYFWYAYNLHRYGTYSHQPPVSDSTETDPVPDSLRAPGYPLLISLLMDDPPTLGTLVEVVWLQAILGTVLIGLVFLVARGLMAPGWSLLAAFLTAISPHLVNAGVYLLTETLYSLMLALVLLSLALAASGQRLRWFALAGAMLGLATLVRPTTLYFPLLLIALCIWQWGLREGGRRGALFLMGFVLVYGVWPARNLVQFGHAGDPQLQINMLHHGMYPNFLFEQRPESFGFPYRFDPRSEEIGASVEAVRLEIARRFQEETATHVKWYLLGKPRALWSWNTVQGMGDAFVYPVTQSPYFSSPIFAATHRVSRLSHTPLVMIAGVFVLLVWVPRWVRSMSPGAVFLLRSIAVMLVYVTVLHMVGAPFPRYAVPFRPELYLAACWMLALLYGAVRQRGLDTRLSNTEGGP